MHVTWNRKAHLNSQSLWMLSATCTTPESLRNKPGTDHGKQRRPSPAPTVYTVHCSCCKPLGKNWYLIVIFTSQVSPARFFAHEPWLRSSETSTRTPKEIRSSSFRFCTATVHPLVQRIWAVWVALASFSNYLTNPLNSSLPLFLQLFHYFNNKFIEWAWFTFIIRGKLFSKENINTAILFYLFWHAY